MSRKALVVGIDHYDNLSPLSYAERDAREIARRLKYDGDEVADDNFEVHLLLSKHQQRPVTRARLREAIRNLFADLEADVPYSVTHGSFRPVYEQRRAAMDAAFDRMETS